MQSGWPVASSQKIQRLLSRFFVRRPASGEGLIVTHCGGVNCGMFSLSCYVPIILLLSAFVKGYLEENSKKTGIVVSRYMVRGYGENRPGAFSVPYLACAVLVDPAGWAATPSRMLHSIPAETPIDKTEMLSFRYRSY